MPIPTKYLLPLIKLIDPISLISPIQLSNTSSIPNTYHPTPITSKQKKEPQRFLFGVLVKEGGHLLSHIALQYHRRKRA